MAHIRTINLKSGNKSYKCIIKSGTTTKSKTFKTKTAARTWGKRVEADKDLIEAYGSAGASITVEELIAEYKENSKDSKYPPAKCHIDFWKKHLGANTKITDVSIIDIKAGLKKRKATPVIKGKKKFTIAPATVNRYRSAISSLFNYAISESYLTKNPAHGDGLHAKEDNARMEYLNDTQRKKLLIACKQSNWNQLHLLVIMAITTGGRLSELLNLKWSDIDFDRATAFLETSKNGEPRVMPLPDITLIELKKFRGIGKGFVFHGTRKAYQPHHFRNAWNTARDSAGLSYFKFHDLRHTCASYLVQNGATLIEVGGVLGHKSYQSTLRYSHLDIDSKTAVVNNTMNKVFNHV